MLRRFTQPCGRWPSGSLHDWPLDTWAQIAKEQGKSVDEISDPAELNQVLARRPKIAGTKSVPAQAPASVGKLPARARA